MTISGMKKEFAESVVAKKACAKKERVKKIKFERLASHEFKKAVIGIAFISLIGAAAAQEPFSFEDRDIDQRDIEQDDDLHPCNVQYGRGDMCFRHEGAYCEFLIKYQCVAQYELISECLYLDEKDDPKPFCPDICGSMHLIGPGCKREIIKYLQEK